ncbi:glycosyltransferase family 4 protein [Salegentibacter chungangensis]|uniref:Glycosyltransferase family 4 protein n=1 Tax=Salegentibacter chungangensis TaxID=1335724 RepID=A0ABW3NQW3_9FLAO
MKKVLIITYYWPPAGGPGVQRWLKFVKYLRDFGVEPVLYIPENPSYPITDKSFLNEVPQDIRLIKKPIFEPYALASIFSRKQTRTISSGIIAKEEKQNFVQRLMLYVRGNFFIPDARKFWVRPSVKFLTEFLNTENIDTVITTGPPHSLHLIGLKLKRKLDVKWIADFRDPWTNIGYHKKLKLSQASQKKHIKLEKEVLNEADRIITTSFTTKEEFQSKTDKPVTVITNGYDITSGEDLSESGKKFSLAHIGSLLSERNPKNLWEALSELVQENKDFSRDLQLDLAGTVSEEVIESINKYRLDNHLKLHGYLSHREALKMQRSSIILLLIEIDSEETKGIIPGKIFEYLAAKRPVIAIGPPNWDAGIILKETEAGKVFGYEEKKSLKEEILGSYKLFKEGQLQCDSKNIEKYSRKQLTGKLAKLISEV